MHSTQTQIKPSEFFFRQATANDLPALKSLGMKAWAPLCAQLETDAANQLRASFSDHATYETLLRQATGFAAIANETDIVGMAFLVPSGNPTEIYQADWSYIRYVSVDPAFGGRGLGKALTQHCVQHASQTGEHTIALHTSEIMPAARHIYEQMGFSILREIDKRLGKRYWLYGMDLQ